MSLQRDGRYFSLHNFEKMLVIVNSWTTSSWDATATLQKIKSDKGKYKNWRRKNIEMPIKRIAENFKEGLKTPVSKRTNSIFCDQVKQFAEKINEGVEKAKLSKRT